MSTDQKTIGFYLDIDSLFDLRASTLFYMDSEKALEAISEDYFSRHHDDFKGYDPVQYREVYDQRHLEIVKTSLRTGVIHLVLRFIRQTMAAATSSPFERIPKVVLNVYPYSFSDDFLKTLYMGLSTLIKHQALVEIINLKPEELTVEYIRSEFAQLSMYDFPKWLDAMSNDEQFGKKQCPEVRLFAPMIVKSEVLSKQFEGMPVFTQLEKFVSPFIRLELIPVSYYCFDIADYMRIFKKDQEEHKVVTA